jgi:signal transduction histidine kinase
VRLKHRRRLDDFAKLRTVIDTIGPVPARHQKAITETTGRIHQIADALADLEPEYEAFFALAMADPAEDPAGEAMAARRAQFDSMMKRFRPSEDEVARLANLAARAQQEMVESLMRRLEYNEQRLLRLTLYLCGSAIVIGLLITVWATLTLRPLRRLRDGARRIAAGDYASRIEEKGPAEVAELAREFNVMGRAVEEREREKVRSERLAAVGKMAAMITHEVRNPLSSIALNTELLEDELGTASAEARQLCGAIQREVDRLTALTEEYLAFARLPRPNLIADQANDVVGAVASFVREDLMARGVTLTSTLAPELPLARVDPAQLRQCLLNLVRNATEAVTGRASPTVTLTTRLGADATVEVEVADNGPGLAPEVEARLFDPFVSTKRAGTGLGLALTHQIIQDHGGQIRVISRPGKGATFTIVLAQASQAARREVAKPATPG